MPDAQESQCLQLTFFQCIIRNVPTNLFPELGPLIVVEAEMDTAEDSTHSGLIGGLLETAKRSFC